MVESTNKTENSLRWEKFLAPVKAVYPREKKDKYDVHNWGKQPCISNELTRKLNELAKVNTEEWERYTQENAAKRNLGDELGGDNEPYKLSKMDTLPKIMDEMQQPVGTDDVDRHGLKSARSEGSIGLSVDQMWMNRSLLTTASSSLSSSSEPMDENVSEKPETRVIPTSYIPNYYEGVLKTATSKISPGMKRTNLQDDKSIPLSKWDFYKHFSAHISFDLVRRLEISPDDQSSTNINAPVGNLYEGIRAIFGQGELKSCIFKEAQARVVLDNLIFKLCEYLDIKVHLEEEIKFQYLPMGKLDYYFKSKEGLPMGCLEAKGPRTMDKKAFGQTVMELVLVQQMAEKKGIDVTKTPFTGILSDGIRFVLIQLLGSFIFLEHDDDVIKIRDINSEEHCRELLVAISKLLEHPPILLENPESTLAKSQTKLTSPFSKRE